MSRSILMIKGKISITTPIFRGFTCPPPPQKKKKRDYLGRDFPRTMTIKYQILTADGKAISHRKSIELHLQNPDYRYNNMIIIHFFFFFTLDGQ